MLTGKYDLTTCSVNFCKIKYLFLNICKMGLRTPVPGYELHPGSSNSSNHPFTTCCMQGCSSETQQVRASRWALGVRREQRHFRGLPKLLLLNMTSASCFQIAKHKKDTGRRVGTGETCGNYFIYCPLRPEFLLCCPFMLQTRVPKRQLTFVTQDVIQLVCR